MNRLSMYWWGVITMNIAYLLLTNYFPIEDLRATMFVMLGYSFFRIYQSEKKPKSSRLKQEFQDIMNGDINK